MTNSILNSKAREAMNDPRNFSTISEDEPICAICKKRIVDDVPLRCWTDDGVFEIAFHPDCALDN